MIMLDSDSVQLAAGVNDRVRLIQFTDLHLYDNPGDTLLGVNTDWSFSAVVQLAKQERWPPDLVLVTGDMVHSGSISGYQKLRNQLQAFNRPTFCLPGNHDIPENMHKVLNAANVSTKRHIRVGRWRIILLDSTIAGEEKGKLAPVELEFLRTCLETGGDDYFLISLHHPPYSVGCDWLDAMALENPNEFFQILKNYPNVKCVLSGHVHQHYEGSWQSARLLCSPSTCVQFRPQCAEFAVDTQTPGYRWLDLTPEGEVVTGVSRLDQLPADIDIAASGY